MVLIGIDSHLRLLLPTPTPQTKLLDKAPRALDMGAARNALRRSRWLVDATYLRGSSQGVAIGAEHPSPKQVEISNW